MSSTRVDPEGPQRIRQIVARQTISAAIVEYGANVLEEMNTDRVVFLLA
jgi:hypothetical protein